MRLYCFLCTSFFFLLPAIVLLLDDTGILTWYTCILYLYMHVNYKQYVYVFHKLDKINHTYNFLIKADDKRHATDNIQ